MFSVCFVGQTGGDDPAILALVAPLVMVPATLSRDINCFHYPISHLFYYPQRRHECFTFFC
jgi:hypothetical protein